MSARTQIIQQGGRKAFAVIPYKDFVRMSDELEDYRDLKDLRRAKADPSNRKGKPFEAVARAMGLLGKKHK